MILRIQRKGKKVLLYESELKEYMSAKLNDLTGLASNVVIALVMVSLIVVLTFFKSRDYYFYALVLLPIIGRRFVGDIVNRWLKNKFKELLILTTGILVVFRGLKFEPDAGIGQKGAFCKGLLE
ncbi:MAG: hypothetical protein JRF31_09265 [Deltaproteobacteria bacterium]|nr:hypothetical protein [Deltaproteobacteria bacterium]